VVAEPDPSGWQPIRPGLSNPRTWLGTTAPNGATYREDDLERIHGVGPYLARRLRDAGIMTWRQVAEWDDDDMTLMSRLIGSFPDRIRREDWPGSARALHAEAYGEELP
jgi:predicted flap endonuclease-1-like 5' DNA nuclease